MAISRNKADRKWSGNRYSQTKPAPAPNDTVRQGQAHYLRSLRSQSPPAWSDDRREQARHSVGAVHVAIKVLMDAAAACEVSVRKYKDGAKADDGEDGSEAVPRGHPLERLIRRPNRKHTGSAWRRVAVQQFCLTGSSLSWHLKDRTGRPAEMWPVLSSHWQPVAPSDEFPDGAYRITPYYSYGPWLYFPGLANPGGAIIPSEEIVHFGYPHPYIQGDYYSPLTACALQLDALDAVDRSRWHTMQQGANPSAVVELSPEAAVPDQPELDRLKEEFAAKFGGPQNAGRIAVLSPGAKLNPWSHAPGDMGWESAWDQLVKFVLSAFGVTKSLAFMEEAGSYASLYASLKQFSLFSLQPLLSLVADALNVQLVWPSFGDDYFVELKPQKVDNWDEKLQKHEKLIQVGAETINELRIDMGLKPVDWGDSRAYPGNVGAAAAAGMADLNPENDAGLPGANPPGRNLESNGPPVVAPAVERAMDSPGRLSRGSLPGKGAAGLNGRAAMNGKA